MKQPRAFIVEPYEPEDEELDYDEGAGLEYGSASEYNRRYYDSKSYTCPKCKTELFHADIGVHGVIWTKCRRCRKEVGVKTTPDIRQIGFINTLEEKERRANDLRCKARKEKHNLQG